MNFHVCAISAAVAMTVKVSLVQLFSCTTVLIRTAFIFRNFHQYCAGLQVI